ncbi:CopG family ribbon-helix-helix protein [uncultured Desulfovibrio sp.]|uniref:CopG family ribbon-helix-helix protein n=1 Tax=uncultured Desulfovibrio sp. TaxID=167968 RepID=UPI00220E1D05|nr:ribbon-helix-helix protein, CopG family [uncultured Desulfovibrio sp.]CAI3235154.1 Prevent host death protein, Phd antitoxin [Desulfovibrio diazotrophicus]
MQQNIATTPASVKLPNPLRERIKSLADARNQSAHAIMLQAIENYVEREEKREALRQEAKAAHEHYMQTGLHLTNAEAVEWMDKIIQGEKVPMPKCHI